MFCQIRKPSIEYEIMRIPSEAQGVHDTIAQLTALLEYPTGVIHEPRGTSPSDSVQPDAVVRLGPYTFVIEWKSSGGSAPVRQAIDSLRRERAVVGAYPIPLVAVPYMGPVGRDMCRAAGVGWLDLSGNAWIVAPGLRIKVHGEPNRFKHRGQIASAFAPKSSRIARWLLMHPGQALRQRGIAHETGVSVGLTSRTIRRLLDDGLVERDSNGRIHVRDRSALLDAWHEVYAFERHEIVRGHVNARSGDDLVQRVGSILQERGKDCAATGLGAAWLYSRFAAFRTATFYVTEPVASLAHEIGFREEPRGANLWLVTPRDPGVFEGATDRNGVRCAHPVQVYLDLKGHAERAKEAAARLRSEFLDDASHA